MLVPLEDFQKHAGFSSEEQSVIEEHKAKTWWDNDWDTGFKSTVGAKLTALGFCDQPEVLGQNSIDMGNGPSFNYRMFKVHESFVSLDNKVGDLPNHEDEWFIKVYDIEEGTSAYQRLCEMLGVSEVQRYHWSVTE